MIPPGSGQTAPEDDRLHELRLRISYALSDENPLAKGDIASLGQQLLQIGERGNPKKIKIFVEENFPLDFQDPETGGTVFHVVAACRARKALREILKSDRIDFLVRDKQGRLASEMAFLYGRDPAVARLLRIKERKQAAAQGIKLTRRP